MGDAETRRRGKFLGKLDGGWGVDVLVGNPNPIRRWEKRKSQRFARM
jgi:hypothetical protein